MRHLIFLSALLVSTSIFAQETRDIRLDTLDLKQVAQGWGSPQKNRSVDKKPISLAGRKFEHGFGTHADSRLSLDLDGSPGMFNAYCGIDDETVGKGSVIFKVVG